MDSWPGKITTSRSDRLPLVQPDGVSAHHCDLDFAGVAESSTWNFRSTELENGVKRKRRTVLTRRCRVGEAAGWTCGWETSAIIPADRDSRVVDASGMSGNSASRSFLVSMQRSKICNFNLIRLTKQLQQLSASDRSRLAASKQLAQADLPETPS